MTFPRSHFYPLVELEFEFLSIQTKQSLFLPFPQPPQPIQCLEEPKYRFILIRKMLGSQEPIATVHGPQGCSMASDIFCLWPLSDYFGGVLFSVIPKSIHQEATVCPLLCKSPCRQGCQIKQSISVCHEIFGCGHTVKKFLFHVKFKFNGAFCFLFVCLVGFC